MSCWVTYHKMWPCIYKHCIYTEVHCTQVSPTPRLPQFMATDSYFRLDIKSVHLDWGHIYIHILGSKTHFNSCHVDSIYLIPLDNMKWILANGCIQWAHWVLLVWSFLWFIVPLLHGSIFPEEIESLELLNDKVAAGHQLSDLLGVRHVFILHEGGLQALSEVSGALWVLTAEIQQL